MNLEIKIKNFGPIDKATIQVGQFTVFAGPNSTGKTLVSKMLYSMLSAVNGNPVLVFFAQMADTIELDLRRFEQRSLVIVERPLSAIRSGFQKIDSILREAFPKSPSQNGLDWFRAIQPELMAEIEEIKGHFETLRNNVITKGESSSALLFEIHPNLEASIAILESCFGDVESAIHLGQRFKFRQNVHGNFQSSDLSNLKGDGDSPLYFSVQEVGELQEIADSFLFTPYPQIVHKQSSSEAFYLESPLYWKLKSALESIKLDSRSPFKLDSRSPFRTLNGVPDYFYDMAVALRRRRIEHPFAGIHESLHDAIGGKISLSEAGDLEFQQKDKSIPLSLTSAGVANMGMLALLIERGALERGAFLFIDEPESNLHPTWQVEMAAFLFELARQGVNVVVSTHSMTILKWLEVHVKEKPEDRELVRLNKFPPDAEWNDDMDTVMAEVKQSLTKPFSDLYIKGL